MTSETPESIGRYKIDSVLGRGAMGVIYRAHDPMIDRQVAIKLVRADLLDGDDRADYLARFQREAQAAGRCTHPNIVAIYDFATHQGNPFLAMEYVSGVSLSQAQDAGTAWSVADASAIMLQVLDALRAAHASGIVHRDIKPANILITDGVVVKVTDFGISRVEGVGLTQDGSVIGTPSYMSPEQVRGETVDARSDLFSAGIVFYEMLARARPFPGRSFSEVWSSLLNDPPPDISGFNPKIGPALKAMLDRALAKPPDARFGSAAGMAAAIRDALAQDGRIGDDRTMIAPARRLRNEGDDGSAVFDRAVLNTLERKLARFVGPIARHLVQSAVRKTSSLETLCQSLAGNIEIATDRDRFVAEVRREGLTASAAATGIAPAASFASSELDRLKTELTRYLGPVAGVLIKRTAPKATSLADLWDRLAAHIERDDERAAFRRKG